jgi:hypothetical protein
MDNSAQLKMNTIIDQLVTAYNAGQTTTFANFFTEDGCTYEHPNTLMQQGREAIFEYYKVIFEKYPQQTTTILSRKIIGAFVIDHEEVQRSPDQVPFEVIAIYTFENNFIKRVDLIRDANTIVRINQS